MVTSELNSNNSTLPLLPAFQRLSDNTLYAEERRDELAQMLREEGELKSQASELEELWFEQQHALEELNA